MTAEYLESPYKKKKSPNVKMFYKSWGQNLCLTISVSTKSYTILCAAVYGVTKSQTWLSDWTEKQAVFFEWGDSHSPSHHPEKTTVNV